MTTDVIARGGRISEVTDEKARRAVKAFRALQPTLSAYARVLSGKKNARVDMAAQDNGSTDGTRIYFRPPLALGDNTPHERRLCDKRDESGLMICPACAIREEVLVTIYHEIAHICFESFARTTDEDKKRAIQFAIREAKGKWAEQIAQRIEKAPEWKTRDYINLAGLINEYLPFLVNALEDARVNAALFKARPGVRRMFDADTSKIFNEGFEKRNADGTYETVNWHEAPLNSQAMIGCFCKASGYNYQGWFHPKVIEALDDAELTTLLRQMDIIRSAGAVYNLSFKVLARLRELGFCGTPQDPDPEPEPEPNPEAEPEPGEESEEQGDEGESGDAGESGEEGASDSDDVSPSPDASGGGEPEGEPDEPASDDASGEAGEEGSGESSDDGPDDDSQDEPEDSGSAEPSGQDADASGDDSEDADSQSSNDAGDSDDPESEPAETGESDDDSDSGESAAGDESTPGDSDSSDETDAGKEGVDDEDSEGQAEADSGSDEAESADGSDSGDSSRDSGGDQGEGEEAESSGVPSEDQSRSPVDEEDHLDDAEETRGEGDLDHENDGGKEGVDSGRTDSGKTGPDDGTPDDSGVEVPPEGDSSDSSHEDEQPAEDSDEGEPVDTGADDGYGGTEVIGESEPPLEPEMGAPEDVKGLLEKWGDHEEKPKSTEAQQAEEAVDKAIVQGIYFTKPSNNIFGVREHFYGKPVIDNGIDYSQAWASRRSIGAARRLGAEAETEVPEKTLQQALIRMRRTFTDNQRGARLQNKKSGRVNSQVLGRRAWSGDARLFEKNVLPGKKNYFVVIGMDISGSTVGKNIALEKRAIMAQAELLDRVGIPFAIYAHTGNYHDGHNSRQGLDLEIYHVKDPDEKWTSKTKERLETIGPSAANLDGHALEFLRKACDERTETDRIIMYYSDGKMPAENHDEELDILTREIRVCRQKNYTLLGVGIRTDSPARHGLDTVEVHEDADLVKVVQHLGKRLSDR